MIKQSNPNTSKPQDAQRLPADTALIGSSAREYSKILHHDSLSLSMKQQNVHRAYSPTRQTPDLQPSRSRCSPALKLYEGPE